ncbi:discoidin domain-containing protein [Mediterraneibacter gnavus]|uniref:discoidin domain-containing protein n=1 Tax=Mediterraneibacter gnavus TaxID=33038 RepID=UPI00232C1FE5|nr:discoidin domain-containing protein [Mediterraneibacter gnavus]MDB8711095.1 discoidin domain-containing protein [Mediterraneibacter gnavus]MDB8714465.1 discoidin domain-containing protein [Mediterraneibacter gnavus]
MRNRKIAKCAALGLAVVITATGMPVSTFATGNGGNPPEAESDWEKVSAILDSYPGIYTEDTKLGSPWNTEHSPDGPLMGNGTVYAFMAGDHKEQNLYISHSNMWQDRTSNNGQEYTTFGGITIKQRGGENLAVGKNVTVSSQVDEDESGSKIVDGNGKTKWCATKDTNDGVVDKYWAVVDLGEKKDISRWVVKHAQSGGETNKYNTRDFKLQYSTKENPDGSNDQDWVDADVVEGNTAGITDRNLSEKINTQYVRLLVTKPTQDDNNAVRIYELELYEDAKTDGGKAQDFQYKEDMKNAEITAQSEDGFTTNTWLSAKENIIVADITNVTEDTLPMEVSAWTANANKAAELQGDVMIAKKTGISKTKPERPSGTGTWEGWKVNLAMASKIIDDAGQTVENTGDGRNTTQFNLEPGQTVTFVSAVEGGKEENGENTMEQAEAKAVEKLQSRTTDEALAVSKQGHRDYWKDYWLKSYIDIQDEKIERMYYGMLYQLGCSTSVSSENNGGVAAGLFPWTAADHPAWQGDYTTNTDFQRQIHPLVTANRTEGIQNYINILKQYWPEAQRRAADVEHLNWVIDGTGRTEQFTEGIEGGALFPTHIGPWGASTEQNNDKTEYWNSPADATSVLMPIVKLWKYTMDEELLQEIYPLMRDVATFWENYVTLEDGKYVVYGATHEGVAGRNPILDVDACKYMLENTIFAAKELGVDGDKIPVWQNILDNMSPVPTFMYHGKETICDVEGRTEDHTGNTFDNNPVTIQSVYYFDSIGMSAPEEEKEKYYNYLEVKNGLGNHRRLISATRLGYDIHEIMEQLKAGSIDPNPGDWEGIRGNNTIGDIGVTARIAVVQDSLLQSNEGFINIFANWYDDQETSFRRLRAENAFLVDADMNADGQVTYAKIHSEKGRDCAVLNPWDDQEMEVYKNGERISTEKTENSIGTVYTFPTEAGGDYELKRAERQEGYLKLDASELNVKTGEVQKLTVETNVENAKIVWESSDTEKVVAGVDGSVLGLKEGEAVITASVEGTELSASCKVTVSKNTSRNVAPLGTAVSSSHHENLTADRAINGEWTPVYEGWTSANESWDTVNSRWLKIDLGQEYTIDRWVLRHDGHRKHNTEDPVGNPEDSENWGNYYLQVSENGEDGWTNVDAKIDNKNNTTDQTLEIPVTGRYFRIYMEFPMFKSDAGWEWEKGYAKLNQVELYEASSETSDISLVEIVNPENVEVEKGTSAEEIGLPENVNVRLNNEMEILVPVVWDKADYQKDTPGTYTLQGNLNLPSAIKNPDNLQAQVQVTVKGEEEAPELDYTELDQKIAEAENILQDADKYTKETVDILESALDTAKDVRKTATTQEEIDTAVKALDAAKDGLVVKDDSNTGTGDGTPGNGSAGLGNDKISGNDDTPKTGDQMSTMIPVAGMGLALLAMVAVVIVRRKRWS